MTRPKTRYTQVIAGMIDLAWDYEDKRNDSPQRVAFDRERSDAVSAEETRIGRKATAAEAWAIYDRVDAAANIRSYVMAVKEDLAELRETDPGGDHIKTLVEDYVNLLVCNAIERAIAVTFDELLTPTNVKRSVPGQFKEYYAAQVAVREAVKAAKLAIEGKST